MLIHSVKRPALRSNSAVRPIAFLLTSMLAAVCLTAAVPAKAQSPANAATVDRANMRQVVFDGARSFDYLQAICELGNRMSGSRGMQRQQELVKKHFEDLGARVTFQRFKAKDPLNRSRRVPMANLIVEWHPEAKQRILLCAHYDTRPLPDRDPNPNLRRNGVFLGANDGASGVALLMELGNHVTQLPLNYGLDFVLFDGEELVYWDGRKDIGPYFLGSTWFADQYRKNPPEFKYVGGVLFDMVADADLTLYLEGNSVKWARPLVKEIWTTAERLGVKEFIPRVKYTVSDDHFPLNRIAKIPVCDVIDFSYPDYPRNRYWHTTADALDRCSGDSLGKVGKVTVEWLSTKR